MTAQVGAAGQDVVRAPTSVWRALVLVQWGDSLVDPLDAVLPTESSAYEDALVIERVRTDRPPGAHVVNVNEAFEFSGYQEGLLRMVSRARTEGLVDDSPMLVVLCNDTLHAGHFRPLARTLLQALLRQPATPLNVPPRLVGLRMPSGPADRPMTGGAGYLSTWAFALVGPLRSLEKVSLYEPPGLNIDALPPVYLQSLHRWLQPTRFWAGWYQAWPGRPLDAQTLRRKTVTVALEHGLPQRLAAQGWTTHDVSEAVARQAFKLPLPTLMRLLRLGDRVHVNWLKLRRRLGSRLRDRLDCMFGGRVDRL